MIELINIVTGIVSQPLFVLCALLQLIKTIKNKDVSGVSIGMWWSYVIAEAFSIVHVLTLPIIPGMILFQVIGSFIICSIELFLIYKYK